ncbi:hypothetical protein NPIL_247691 [Nephila pilipes]|uniref:Uncharacterized protein n=1 Tax=Nephila pilipes TaxID=299642 RepID=A0A8X6MEC7_NEPPI|nr:hypothetical protein NPIL_247691 [Nephila pilipes]
MNNQPNINSEASVDVEKVLKFCNVKSEVNFADAVPFWKQKSAKKICEGAYGEIYSFSNVDGTRRILKCIPINGKHPMSSYQNISLVMAVPDIISSKLLSDLNEGSIYVAPNFPMIYSINLVQDRFPELLMTAWWDYKNGPDRLKDPTGHPQPDKYPEQQLFLTIESSYCGEPLTRNILQNAWLGVSIMSQIVSALAVAEAAYNFEHRDLHLENILVQNTKAVSLKYTMQNKHFSVQTIGYHIFIIDFTLSRIYHDKNVYCIELDGIIKKCESKEPVDNIWFDHMSMYKIMAEYSKSQWDKYMPITNIIWLKHINENILNYLEKNNPHFTKLVPPVDEHDQMTAIRLLRKWNDCILQHKSATDLLQNVILQDNPLIFVHQ